MTEHNKNTSIPRREKTPDTCPHCGKKLSQWEQVILSVDRMLMCKNCWYRIILDVFADDDKPQKSKES